MNNFTASNPLPDRLPLVPLRDVVMFPGTTLPIASGRAKSKAALDQVWSGSKMIVFVTQKNARIDDPGEIYTRLVLSVW